MAVLVDTNILLRLVQPDHPDALYAKRSVSILCGKGKTLNIASQNLIEFWAVATRSRSENGLGLQGTQARAEIETMKGIFSVLPELPLQNAWERLVVDHGVSGKSTHDAHLVAAMIVSGIGSILTSTLKTSSDIPRFWFSIQRSSQPRQKTSAIYA